MKYLFILVLLAGCAAAPPPDPCSAECSRVVDACMDASSMMKTEYALDRLKEQCSIGEQACLTACRQHP